MAYYIYGSYNGGRYKAMDMNAGVQVGNLIYATVLWDDKQKSQFESQLDKLHKENPEWKFEVRKAG